MASKRKTNKVYEPQNTFVNRESKNEIFNNLNVSMQTLDTALYLLQSEEEPVLFEVLRHTAEFIRKSANNINEVKDKNMLDHLLAKEFFLTIPNTLIKRFTLYIVCAIVENMNVLTDLETSKTFSLTDLCLRFYLEETDDFCLEYLTVIINSCLDDPQMAVYILKNDEYLEKFFFLFSKTDDPDLLFHSFEALYKLMRLQNTEDMQRFVTSELFPIERLMCDLTNQFEEIRTAALKNINFLIADTSEVSPFANEERAINMLQQLTKMFCNDAMVGNLLAVIDVLSTAMRNEKLTQLFFEQNLFDKIVQHICSNETKFPFPMKCKVLSIFAENPKFERFIYRLHVAKLTEIFVDCLVQSEPEPATHVVLGLNRIMKFADAATQIVESYSKGVLPKLLAIILNDESNIKTREQAAELIGQLLIFSFHSTAGELMELQLPVVLADTFGQGVPQLSIDLIIFLLNVVETLAQNEEYRQKLGDQTLLTCNLALLLKNSFATAVLVSNIFRAICMLLDEQPVRETLLDNFIGHSIKRGLKSISNLVKTAVTNFIMQTTRFPEFVQEYIDNGVLEVLIMHQKHAFCVSTWGPAIESILSKSATLKFAIRNHLSFVDITVGNDFMVSKKKFDDFRIFLNILREEVSPLYPMFIVNFDRNETDEVDVVQVPPEVLTIEECLLHPEGWCYCKKPGDSHLPEILDQVNTLLEKHGLIENPDRVRRCVDFENVAKRAKVIADVVAQNMSENLKSLDLNAPEECSRHTVKCHLKDLMHELHCTFIPIGMVQSGCEFERAVLFKVLADQIGLPSTLQRSVDGKHLFNEVPIPLEAEYDIHCDKPTMKFMPWRLLRPTHIVDLVYNVGELYPIQSRQAMQYLRLY